MITKKITAEQIKELADASGYEYAALMAVIKVESGGIGFGIDGKILIQFEPIWFRRLQPYTPSGLWSVNKVERQAQEWKAFNDAFKRNPEAAMKATSIGMMQVMGFHFKMLGFKTVGEMWDYAKESEYNQLEIAIRFIKSNPKMDAALKKRNWTLFAYFYNGRQYKKFKYDTRLAAEYKRHSPSVKGILKSNIK